MRPGRLLDFLFVLGLILLSACNLPPPSVICQPSDLVAPELMGPQDQARVSTNTPLLTWVFKAVSHPYPQSQPSLEVACQPEKYRVSISTAPLYTDELGGEVTGTSIAGGWTTPTLQGGRTYRWNVTAISKGGNGPSSEMRTFSVGNSCELTDLQAPSLLAPSNGAIVDTVTPTFMWDSVMTCLPDGYLLRYSTDPDLVHGSTVGGGILNGSLNWLGSSLSDCTIYYWRVAAYHGEPPAGLGPWEGKPNVGPSSETWMFKVQLPGTMSCWKPPEPTATATSGLLQSVSETWQVTMNANCRVGPGTTYNESGFAPAGYAAHIEGRNEDGSWFRLIDPNGVSCWVSRVTLTVPQDWESLKVLTYPTPAPTPKPRAASFDCSKLTDANSCLAHPGCIFDRVQAVCRNP